MKQELLEKFADECERLAEEKETEREWLSDYANMVLEEAAKVCDTKAEFMAMMGGSCDPDVLAEQIRALKAPNAPHEGPARASCAGPLDAVVGALVPTEK